jgi:hypothetical protein
MGDKMLQPGASASPAPSSAMIKIAAECTKLKDGGGA